MNNHQVVVSFPGVSPDIANSRAEALAAEIRREVRDGGRRVDPEIRRTDPGAMDFGTTLVLVLGAPAIVVLANAIRDWARRTEVSDLDLNGIRIDNVNSHDVAEIIRALNSQAKAPDQ